jgi:hypothetical protein
MFYIHNITHRENFSFTTDNGEDVSQYRETNKRFEPWYIGSTKQSQILDLFEVRSKRRLSLGLILGLISTTQ